MEINGGNIRLTSQDDGINAAGGSDSGDHFFVSGATSGSDQALITINGGTMSIEASGDGIDSNGSIIINGGEIYVDGPSDSGNGALDYDRSAAINGGSIVAVGSAGMAQGFGTESTQFSILYNLPQSQSADTTITLTDDSGKVLLSHAPGKAFQSIVLSCPELESGEKYTITCGSTNEEITLTDMVWSNSGSNGIPGGSQAHPGNKQGGKGQRKQEESEGISKRGTSQELPEAPSGNPPDEKLQDPPERSDSTSKTTARD